MNSFILGFQRLVWCPKWTPASSNSFMVMFAKLPPHLDCIPAPGLRAQDYIPATPLPARDTGRFVKPVASCQWSVASEGSNHPTHLTLRVLEALARALLPVLLALLGARVAREHAR